jgi:hypothetical protein
MFAHTMSCQLLISFFALLLALPVSAQSQFNSPAFDPKVYCPTFGDPVLFDTLYGSQHEQQLGLWLTRVNDVDERKANIVIKGWPTKGAQSVVQVDDNFQFESIAEKSFNVPLLGTQKSIGRELRVKNIRAANQPDLLLAHPAHVPVVYWADDRGASTIPLGIQNFT